MPDSVTQCFQVRNELAEIERVAAALARLWRQKALPPESEMPVSLALEEVLSNVMRHAYAPGQPCDIRVRLTADCAAFEFEVSDGGVPFDPLSVPDPDVSLPLEQRQPGGLGVFLVRRLADELRYDRHDGRNHLVFRKNLGVE